MFFLFSLDMFIYNEDYLMKKIIPMLSAAFLFFGCATNSMVTESKLMKERIVVYGAFKAEYAGKITFKEDKRCDVNNFIHHARVKEGMDKVVDILMEESTSGASYSCTYWGIGLKYKPMDVNETARWESAMSQLGSESDTEKPSSADSNGSSFSYVDTMHNFPATPPEPVYPAGVPK